jgi:hypothetical protein
MKKPQNKDAAGLLDFERRQDFPTPAVQIINNETTVEDQYTGATQLNKSQLSGTRFLGDSR